MTTTATFTYPYLASYTEAHVDGCKAIHRRVKGVESDIGSTGVTLETIRAMQANPDEGHLKIHACLKPFLTTTKGN